jgi:hypothetical protein
MFGLSAKTTKSINLRPLKNVDMSPVLNSAAEIVRKNIRKRFKDGTDVNGSPLTPLKPKTIAAKKKAGYASPELPLTAKGNLAENQLIERATKSVQRAIVYISTSGKNYKGLQADILYGYHDSGAGNLPARKPFGIADNPDRKEIADYFHRFITRIVLGLGK